MLVIGLVASLTSLAISASMDTILGMWLAIVPTALLNHNWSVLKARPPTLIINPNDDPNPSPSPSPSPSPHSHPHLHPSPSPSPNQALFADYIAERGGSDADRAGAVGNLGPNPNPKPNLHPNSNP